MATSSEIQNALPAELSYLADAVARYGIGDGVQKMDFVDTVSAETRSEMEAIGARMARDGDYAKLNQWSQGHEDMYPDIIHSVYSFMEVMDLLDIGFE